ncbi:MAG: hypothetical protein GXP27_14900 [Planctomycetes bacterium]|nr:hypothetical protein [Planctomycetota bacterium]
MAEITSSSVSIDLHAKRHVCRRSGVREYLVWRVLDREIDWFVLREGEYQRLEPDKDGLPKSEVSPGLWLDAAALLRGDLQTILNALDRGTNSIEHAELLRKLSSARSRSCCLRSSSFCSLSSSDLLSFACANTRSLRVVLSLVCLPAVFLPDSFEPSTKAVAGR